jgi:hypothetical protein
MKPKHAIEVLPSKGQLALDQTTLDQLSQAVLQNIANRDAAETDEELSESILSQPWCLPRKISQEIRRLIPVCHFEKYALVYDEHGCFKCERKDVPHQSLGMCSRCYGLLLHRLKAVLTKQAGETAGRPSLREMKAALTLKADSAHEILAEITARHAAPKRLGAPRP